MTFTAHREADQGHGMLGSPDSNTTETLTADYVRRKRSSTVGATSSRTDVAAAASHQTIENATDQDPQSR